MAPSTNSITSITPTTTHTHNDDAPQPESDLAAKPKRIALLGCPNTGKTSLFNRLCGVRHKTSNFPGTTQEARIGSPRALPPGSEIVDLPGIYSLELDQSEAFICRQILAGQLAMAGESLDAPDAVLVVADATNLARSLMLVGEATRRGLPMVVAINMVDQARKRGIHADERILADQLGIDVVVCSARTGEGIGAIEAALAQPHIPRTSPPGTVDGLEHWADDLYARMAADTEEPKPDTLTDRLDKAFTHPALGLITFIASMTGFFWIIFKLAAYPMDWIDAIFTHLGALVGHIVPPGPIHDLLANGVVAGVGSTVIFLPQICILFFLISLLEDTGYLARAAFIIDKALRPFGLSGHAFVPFLSSHACAIPGIIAARGVPDKRDRLATILAAPYMSCSARIPVYVLLTVLLFPNRPSMQALAFAGCYVLGVIGGLLSAMIARRTILPGKSRAMVMELPSYRMPSLTNALLLARDRGIMFLKKAGTAILAISIVLWWLGAYPHGAPPADAVALRTQAHALLAQSTPTTPTTPNAPASTAIPDTPDEPHDLRHQHTDSPSQPTDSPSAVAELAPAQTRTARSPDELFAQADMLEAKYQKRNSYLGRLGATIEPIFHPLGYDRQLSVGVLASFAAREVFVSTMAVQIAGSDDAEDEGIKEKIQHATRDDGITPVFTPATSWSLLIYYVLAMQCLPTLMVTAKESGHAKWALLQLVWMSGNAYLITMILYHTLRAVGIT